MTAPFILSNKETGHPMTDDQFNAAVLMKYSDLVLAICLIL